MFEKKRYKGLRDGSPVKIKKYRPVRNLIVV